MSEKIIRKITSKEIKLARKSHLIGIPIYLVAALIIFILLKTDSLPAPAKYGGIAIGCLAIIVFTGKIIQLERELKNGEIEELTGIVTDKIKFGGGQKSNSTQSKQTTPAKSQTTYIIKIEEEKFWVKPKFYKVAEINKKVKMIHLRKSQVLLDLKIIN